MFTVYKKLEYRLISINKFFKLWFLQLFFPFSVSKTKDENTGAKSSNTFNRHEITGEYLRYLHCTEISYKDEIFLAFLFLFLLHLFRITD